MTGKLELTKIPFPPGSLLEISAINRFAPAPELNEFIEKTILDENHALYNLEHIHLAKAHIGFLWASAPYVKQGKRIAGTAEIPMFRVSGWQKARQEMQMEDWFGTMPDFVITLDAHFRAECEPIEFLAVLEHELYHCGQATDEYGLPKFSRTTGLPKFTMKPHDIEEFSGVVRRYGIEATGQDRVDFVQAALTEPEIAPAKVRELCGTC